MIPDPELEKQLTDDIALEAATEGGELPTDVEAIEDDDAADLEEVQDEAPEERTEGGVQ
ncbi:hypothetical protein Q4F19_07240 [Sphingomonas sp. BIUV-7]|uniref:Uncharacterized protein n=1 Tax=Sphingomonas natans TaxID=3063330 RepID=A0ABT8Y797_9SPHN|nr:hypothetical protein [Sphingomonas sp. BIUV-7]MDO6414171.1 hypothetical protein [Sphingomonas sp. BIUV-7]